MVSKLQFAKYMGPKTTLAVVPIVLVGACSSAERVAPDSDNAGSNESGAPERQNDGGAQDGSFLANGETGAAGPSGDPKTCEEAAQMKSYIGCDYWPTIVANPVWSIFDFAAIVANAGDRPAEVTVTGPNGTTQKATVAPQGLANIYLPWVTELKGPDADVAGVPAPLKASVFAPKGAYHLVSSVPVTVYQFNALEYQAKGGPPGKNWSTCPATQAGRPCFSYSDDASLLLPSTAMTGNYRITSIRSPGPSYLGMAAFFAVTGTADGTHVRVKTSTTGAITAGGKASATSAGGLLDFTLDAGDVVELFAPFDVDDADLSGSQVAADKPVQVIAGVPCIAVPANARACDHVEESVLPSETLGKHYVVTVPTSPNGKPIGHHVRVYGNVDGTTLQGLPATCGKSTLNAGQVLDCGIVTEDFEVTGDHEFAVASFQQSADATDAGAQFVGLGDPSQSQMIAVEQFRTRYAFLAPMDYDMSYLDLVAPRGTQIALDGEVVPAAFEAVGAGNLAVARIKLGPGQNGAHVVTGDQPFGIQVLGYGHATSYQYPGGLDLHAIAPPPPPPR